MVDGLVKKEVNGDLISTLEVVGDGLKKGDPAILAPGLAMLTEWKKRIDTVIDMTKTALKKKIIAEGTQTTEKGSRELIVAGWSLAIRPQTSEDALDEDKVQGKLLARGIPAEQGMDATVIYKPNRAKLLALVEAGKLTESDMKDMQVERKYNLQAPKKLEQVEAEVVGEAVPAEIK